MKTAVIYARYSSNNQTEQSIEGQLRCCYDYAERNDILIVDTYIDRAMTGTNDNRADFQRMLKDSYKQAWDIVLVYKLDRFSRNKFEMATHKKTLKDNKIKLVSAMENIPDSPEGIILESLLEGMAEYYSAELSQKVRRGMHETRLKGNFTGGNVIYGYKVVDKKICIDEEKAEVVRYIYKQYASGVYVKDIIEDLTNKGIYNNKGKPFAKNSIYNILKNERYSGVYHFNNIEYTNAFPRIVPEDLYSIVKERNLESRYGKHTSEAIYLLKNKLICGCCGKPMTSESGTSSNGEIKRYYKCLNKKRGISCKKKAIKKDLIEDFIIDITFKIFSNPKNLTYISDMILAKNKKRIEEHIELNLLLKEKANIQKAIDNLLDCMEQGIITSATKDRLEKLEKQLDKIEDRIVIEKTNEKFKITKEEIIKYLKKGLKNTGPFIIKTLIKNIVLYDDRAEIFYNYTDSTSASDFEEPIKIHEETKEYINDHHLFHKEPETTTVKLEAYIK